MMMAGNKSTSAGHTSASLRLPAGHRLGRQLLIDLFECPAALLDNEEFIAATMVSAARESGASVVNSTFHRFLPCGVSGVVAIRESHLAIHTWPEYGYAAVDIFTCGDSIDPEDAVPYIVTALGAGDHSIISLKRGILPAIPDAVGVPATARSGV